MTINHDVYSFELLKNGSDLNEVTCNSSQLYLESLVTYNLIKIEEGRIYLTERGEAAKLIGVKKYLEIEKYEGKVRSWNIEKRRRDIRFLKLSSLLVTLLAALLVYVNYLLSW